MYQNIYHFSGYLHITEENYVTTQFISYVFVTFLVSKGKTATKSIIDFIVLYLKFMIWGNLHSVEE
jgi:hypothetical protein